MKTTTLRSLVLLLFAIVPLAGHAAAPANDKFEKATVLVPAAAKLLNQTGVSSTPDPLDPFIGGVKLARSVWYRFDADASSNLAHIIINDNAGVRAAVFQLLDPDGNAGTLGFIAQTNNTIVSDVETLTFPTAIGRRYYVCIEANGLFDIKLQIPQQENLPVPVPGRLAIVMDEGGISGSVDVTVSATGVVTGKVVLATGVFPFKGTLVNGSLTVRLGPATAPVRTITIQLLNAASKSYRITLNDGETGTVASATVTSSNFTKLTPCPVAGTHTIADLGGFGTVPQLMAASIKVDVLGNAVISGKLFDGTPLIGSGAVDANNIVWIGCTLYKGKGRAVSAAILTATPQTIGLASFGLLRPGRANQASELPPIDALVGCLVARYIPPTAGQRVLQIWNPAGVGNADIDGGGFVGTVTKSINTSTANKVTVNLPNPEALKITLVPGTGFFSGTVLPPGSTKTKPIHGVLIQGGPSNGGGLGHFLNGTTAGKVAMRGP